MICKKVLPLLTTYANISYSRCMQGSLQKCYNSSKSYYPQFNHKKTEHELGVIIMSAFYVGLQLGQVAFHAFNESSMNMLVYASNIQSCDARHVAYVKKPLICPFYVTKPPVQYTPP